jgi:hypothetical protein
LVERKSPAEAGLFLCALIALMVELFDLSKVPAPRLRDS